MQLTTLSEPTARLVTTLAMLRGAPFAVLEAATGIGGTELDAAIDEATDAELVTDDGVRVEFVDPAASRAISRGITGRRRQRLHAEIANRLASGSVAAANPAVVAEQLQRAGPLADPALVPVYARAAGDDAFALGAWSDAARHYEAALRATALEDRERADLEYRAALAAYRNIDKAAAAAGAARAARLAERAGDLRIWGDAALLHSRVTFDPELVEHFLKTVGDREPSYRARMHATLSELSFTGMRLDSANVHSAAAQLAIATVDDPSAEARVEFVIGLQCLGTLSYDDASAHLSRCEERARRGGDALVETWARGRKALVSWSRGNLVDASRLATDVAEKNRANGWWAEYSLATAVRAGIAVAQGNLAAAERFGAEAASAHGRTEHGGVAGLLWSALASARVLRGDVDGAHAALREWEHEDPRPIPLYRALVDALAGANDDADRARFPTLLRANSGVDVMSVSLASTAVELADALARPAIASGATELLAAAYAKGIRFTPGWCAFVPRLVGVAYMLEGSHAEALAWFSTAEADAGRSGAVGEVARARFDRARCLLASGVEASAPLVESMEAFERLGFRPLVRAARRLAGKSDDGPVAESGSTRIIMVTDIIDSTPLTQRVGDRRFVELLREHNRIVRTRLQQFDGVEFKHTGDGIAAWFLTAGAAVECGLLMLDDLERANADRVEDALFIRIGIAAGEVVADGADVFGLAVITAFRICDHARDGRILVSKEVPPLARGTDIAFVRFGDVALKGFADATPLYAVEAKRR
jgi:class 3 adenylate cyclase